MCCSISMDKSKNSSSREEVCRQPRTKHTLTVSQLRHLVSFVKLPSNRFWINVFPIPFVAGRTAGLFCDLRCLSSGSTSSATLFKTHPKNSWASCCAIPRNISFSLLIVFNTSSGRTTPRPSEPAENGPPPRGADGGGREARRGGP